MAKILFVDDSPEDVNPFLVLIGNKAEVAVYHPDEVDDRSVRGVDLILIDYKLDYWPAREEIRQVGFRPLTGLALAAVLRDYVNLESQGVSPVAFGILSGHLDELSRGLPIEHRRQVLAANNNLEWIFSKKDPDIVARQAVSLATAVEELPAEWPRDDADGFTQQITDLLKLRDSDWRQRALEDVERCHPPLHELSTWSHGLAMVRWLLHLILPYPCFLVDLDELALRLRVSRKSLDSALSIQAFREVFSAASYEGILSEFDGARWWRSGVESILWELTGGRSFDVPTLHAQLRRTFAGLESVDTPDPVIGLDENYMKLPHVVSATGAVRIQPDHWPTYAEPAWTPITSALDHPNLRALVIEQDRPALEPVQPNEAS